MTTAQVLGPDSVSRILFVPWLMLYLARLRNAGRSAWNLLHVVPVFALVLAPIVIAPDAFAAYIGNAPSAPGPSPRDTLLFLACMLGAIAYYLAFAIWLGCVKTKTPADPTTLADAFS